MGTFSIVSAIVLLALGGIHSIIYLIAKGIIWVADGLFNIDWYSKFWYIYVLVLILNTLFSVNKCSYKWNK